MTRIREEEDWTEAVCETILTLCYISNYIVSIYKLSLKKFSHIVFIMCYIRVVYV